MSVNRRAKDIINRTNNNYVRALKGDYSKLLEGGYNYITYYQINDRASIHDNTLETYHSKTGKNASYKYNRIYDVALYGSNPFDLQNVYGERGLLTNVVGEGVFLPGTIVPVSGEFFTFDLDDYRNELFEVTDVQWSDMGPEKYYKISYVLYQENVDEVYGNVEEDYVMQPNEGNSSGGDNGTGNGSVIKKADAAHADDLKNIYDSLLKEYVKDYFDEETNTFVYRMDDDACSMLWSPYLQHFLCSNKILNYFTKDIMTELYLLDIDEFDNKDIYKESIYRKSIFKAVEQQKNIIGDLGTWACISDKNLRVRNLPFFFSPKPYKLLDMGNMDTYMYITGFNFFLTDEKHPFSKAEKYQKFITPDDLNDDLIYSHIQIGDLLYQLDPENKLFPIETYYVADGGIVLPASGKDLINSEESYTNDLLFLTIKKFINKNLTLDKDFVCQMKNYFADVSVRNYIFIPIILYIMRQMIENASSSN